MANATSTSASHISRALDLFNSETLYVGIGQQSPWTDENTPPTTDPTTLAINQVIGYKKVSDKYMVVPDPSGSITYRDSQWRIVPPNQFEFQLVSVTNQGSQTIVIQSYDAPKLDSLTTGSKIMLQDSNKIGHISKITHISGTGSQRTLTVEDGANKTYGVGTICHWGLIAEICRSVFLGAWIRFDELPLYPYRIIGIFNRLSIVSGVSPSKLALLPSEVSSPGICEVIEFRRVTSRDIDQKEYLSAIVEF
jgi:hypothetical protein